MFKKQHRQIQLIDIFNDLEREDHIRERIEKQLGQKNDLPFTGLNSGFGGTSFSLMSSNAIPFELEPSESLGPSKSFWDDN